MTLFFDNSTAILGQETYLKKLGKEIPLYPKDLTGIYANWSTITSIAETLLPQLPDIGFFSRKKRRLAYLHIERKLEVMVLQETISREVKGHILLLLEYSNSQFRKASRAGPLHKTML